MSLDFQLYVPRPLCADDWQTSANQFDLNATVDMAGGMVVVTRHDGAVCCTVFGPEKVDFNGLPALERITDKSVQYDAECSYGPDTDLATLLLQRVAEANSGWLFDPQEDDWYPHRPDKLGSWDANASAQQWLARSPHGWRTARTISVALLVAGIIAVIVVAIKITVAENQAGGKLGRDANTAAAWQLIGSLVIVVLLYFTYTVMADRCDAQRREAARRWLASLANPPEYLPIVFASAFRPSRLASLTAFVIWVIGGGLILGGCAFFALGADEEFPQPAWLWGTIGVVTGAILVALGVLLHFHTKNHADTPPSLD